MDIEKRLDALEKWKDAFEEEINTKYEKVERSVMCYMTKVAEKKVAKKKSSSVGKKRPKTFYQELTDTKNSNLGLKKFAIDMFGLSKKFAKYILDDDLSKLTELEQCGKFLRISWKTLDKKKKDDFKVIFEQEERGENLVKYDFSYDAYIGRHDPSEESSADD